MDKKQRTEFMPITCFQNTALNKHFYCNPKRYQKQSTSEIEKYIKMEQDNLQI